MKRILPNLRRILFKQLLGWFEKRFYVLPIRFSERMANYKLASEGRFLNDIEAKASIARMHAHVLDKVLERRDWEPGHGGRVSSKLESELADINFKEDPSLEWAANISERYRNAQERSSSDRHGMPPKPSGIDYNTFTDFLKNRTSTRSYTEEPVARWQLEAIAGAALEASWSCNRQALRIYSTLNRGIALKVLSCFKGFTCYSGGVPVPLVFAVDIRPYYMPSELFVPTVDVGLSAQNAALMAFSLGLNLTFLSWGSRSPENEKALRGLLGIPDYIEVVVGATCGFPADIPQKPARRDVSEVLFFYEDRHPNLSSGH